MYTLRPLVAADFDAVRSMALKIYPDALPWTTDQLASHLRVFPDGQLVVVEDATGNVVGYAATLIVFWDDYEMDTNWRDFTDHGYFTNHDPVRGRTLYAADVMVDPGYQGKGVGKRLYRARNDLLLRLGLLRIRAGARLQGYSRHRDTLSPEAYVREVVAGRLSDATLSFQLNRGFKVLESTMLPLAVNGFVIFASNANWMRDRHFARLVDEYMKGSLKGPFDDMVRMQAGFSEEELADLREMEL